MLAVNFNGSSAFLLDDAPNWSGAVTVEAQLPASYERGLTGKETRRATGDTLRLGMKWTATLTTDTAVTNLRNALQALNTQSVLCPFWPAGFAAGTAPQITAQYYALFNADGSFAAIQPAAALPFALTAYPLLVGILHDAPDPELFSMSSASVNFDFAENDNAYFVTPAAFVPPAGIAAASGVRPLFPWRANWTSSPKSGGAEVDIDRQQIGQQRALSQIYYTQRNRRRISQSFTLTGFDGLNLLAFFVSLGGETNSFWLPTSLIEASLTAGVASGAAALTVDQPAAIGTNTFILLDDGTNRVPLSVASVAGNNWNLTAAPVLAFAAGTTNVESLVLARFDALKLSLKFTSPQHVDADLKFKELPWETAAVAGETIGTTMGPLPTTAMLYVFTLTTPGANTVYRFTNFERNLTDANGNLYTSAPIENDDITDAPNLERQNVTVKTRNFAGNPLALLIPFQLEFPLMLDISEGNVTGNGVAIINCYFSGEVSEVQMDGPLLTATCESLSWIFDRTTARRIYQQNDNFNLFEAANGLTPSDWQWNAVVVSYDVASATLVIGTISANNAPLNGATALTAHYFSAGSVQVTTAGKTSYRMVGDNTALTAGQIIVSLTAPLATAPNVGDVVAIFAGYDGQYETAVAKFNNGAAFGGFPFIPVGNPFVMKITQNPGGGKK
jgi:hypothetical protein